MAGYFIYSLDWDKFRRFVDSPTRPQLLAFARLISDDLDVHDQEFEEDDPFRDWPSEPEDLCDLVQQRLMEPDWYDDLSVAGKDVWAGALTRFCNRAKRKDMGFRVESDGVYWDVIELARRHHGIPPDRITEAVISHFGTRPYRYHPPTDSSPNWGDWMPYHSMHTPEEVQKLLEELKEAAPTILSSPEEEPKLDYEEELMPAVQKVARAGRLLYIGVDT